jgi:hypothetical protein
MRSRRPRTAGSSSPAVGLIAISPRTIARRKIARSGSSVLRIVDGLWPTQPQSLFIPTERARFVDVARTVADGASSSRRRERSGNRTALMIPLRSADCASAPPRLRLAERTKRLPNPAVLEGAVRLRSISRRAVAATPLLREARALVANFDPCCLAAHADLLRSRLTGPPRTPGSGSMANDAFASSQRWSSPTGIRRRRPRRTTRNSCMTCSSRKSTLTPRASAASHFESARRPSKPVPGCDASSSRARRAAMQVRRTSRDVPTPRHSAALQCGGFVGRSAPRWSGFQRLPAAHEAPRRADREADET